jgi:hypothetical protein
MDWLLPRQDKLERALARRHLSEGTLALYDVSSTYFEGRCCPLPRATATAATASAINCRSFGLLTNADGLSGRGRSV